MTCFSVWIGLLSKAGATQEPANYDLMNAVFLAGGFCQLDPLL